MRCLEVCLDNLERMMLNIVDQDENAGKNIQWAVSGSAQTLTSDDSDEDNIGGDDRKKNC